MTGARHELEHAAELLGRLLPLTTPAPWIDGTVEGNRYGALVHPGCHRDCDAWHAEHGSTFRHPHEGYGGCLVAESFSTIGDRRLLAVLRNVADHLPALLEAVAHEDPADAGQAARAIARAVIDTHRPRGQESA